MTSIIAPDADAWTSPSMMLWNTCFSDMSPPRLVAYPNRSPQPNPLRLFLVEPSVDRPNAPFSLVLAVLVGEGSGVVSWQGLVPVQSASRRSTNHGEASTRTVKRRRVPADRGNPPEGQRG